MDTHSPAPDSLRKLIHDINQQVFLLRGHCELAKASNPDPEMKDHLDQMELALEELNELSKRLKLKQLELAPEE